MHQRIRFICNLFLIFVFMIPGGLVPAASQAPAPVESVVSSSGLYRSVLVLPDQAALHWLNSLQVKVLHFQDDTAEVLVTEAQLEALVRLRFVPLSSDELNQVVTGNALAASWLAQSLEGLISSAASLNDRSVALESASLAEGSTAEAAQVELAQAFGALLDTLSPEQMEALTNLSSIDDDADGLTNTQEGWWCTNPLNADSDGDGASDSVEVTAAKDWLANKAASYPSTGKPFASWPPLLANCPDADLDSVPDMAERWELGLNMNLESTDRDKFDDGQELFGLTYCPGSGGYCGYGLLPRNEDWGTVVAQMPSWVKSPGNHPLVAAYPVPEVDVVPSSLNVQTVTTVTTDKVITSGTTKSYSTARTEGTSTSVADTETWNSWEESSTAVQHLSPIMQANYYSKSINSLNEDNILNKLGNWMSRQFNYIRADWKASTGCLELQDNFSLDVKPGGVGVGVGAELSGNSLYWDSRCRGAMTAARKISSEWANDFPDATNSQQNAFTGPLQIEFGELNRIPQALDNLGNDIENVVGGFSGINRTLLQTGELIGNRLFDISFLMKAPKKTETNTKGQSYGGARTTTTENYEEHTVTNGEAFSTEESWGTATAIDAAHTADLRFSYKVSNKGTEYARQLCNLAFSVYIGSDPNPAYTYFVAPDLGGSGCFNNLMPGNEFTYTSHAIPLSLEQMKAIDLGGPVRVVVEDYTYGIDELFYQDAANAGVLVAIEDGTEDGNEAIETYLLPTWGTEMVLDVMGRYFPHETDADGLMTAIWTPEYREDTPSWCVAPVAYGLGLQRTLWCKHALSTADWWNIYTSGMGNGTTGLHQTPAAPGATALFRFNKDTDLDGYSDRSEVKLGTNPTDAASFPMPELLAGMHSIQAGNVVTATLSFLNTGLYDAYGVEAVMVAQDDSITILNNTVGGSGRVRAQQSVVVGSRVMAPQYSTSTWTGTAKPVSSGYFNGTRDVTYTLTVACSNPSGCPVGAETWSVNWTSSLGGSGSLNFGAGYASPTPLSIGASWVEVGLLSGTAMNGNSFTIQARTPRDTFQYQINTTPYHQPVVIVSYNDPQGNHRFIVPPAAMALSSPGQSLAGFAGGMLPDVGVEIMTGQAFVPGANTTDLVVNLPVEATLTNAHLFLEFINISGTVVSEVPYTVTLQTGPNVVPIAWNTAGFSPAYNPAQDYILMAFLTDYEGNILDTAGRPLSSFQADPRPAMAMDAADETWNFGTVKQGTLLQRDFTLASVGYMDLLTYIGSAQGITLSGPGSQPIPPADAAQYVMTINTDYLAVGAFSQAIPVRTSDPLNPMRTITITGTIEPYTPDGTQSVTIRPLDWTVEVTGTHTAGEWITYTHNLGPTPQSLHPIKVYDQTNNILQGVGKFATDFNAGVASYEVFGDGHDGPLNITSNTTYQPFDSPTGGTYNTYTLYATNLSFEDGQKILIHQSRGVGAGQWEINEIAAHTADTITLTTPLKNTYVSGAQVLVLAEYTDVTIQNGATLSVKPWNGTVGGILAFQASGNVEIAGTINASGTTGTIALYNPGSGPGTSGGGFRGGAAVVIADTSDAYSGEGTSGPSGQSSAANGNGGGGGDINSVGAACGGGGNNGGIAEAGDANNGQTPGAAGGAAGTQDLTSMVFGGGGGGGAINQAGYGGDGGSGGGIVFLAGANIEVTGSINASGGNGGGITNSSGAGGGGGGGSILIKAKTATLGEGLIVANGGTGGLSQGLGYGGNGGVGRIRVEYCESKQGNTSPSASFQPLTCYIAEQVEGTPTQGRLRLPENISTSKTYKIQYGRRFVFSSAGEQNLSLRLPKQLYTGMSLEALVSNTGISSGPLNLSLDIGDNASTDWSYSGTTIFPATFEISTTVDALNAYLISHTAVPWGMDIDVPFKVTIDRAADMMLTNLELSIVTGEPAGQTPQGIDPAADLPLDWTLQVNGPLSAGTWVSYTHTLGPDKASLHPVRVYDQPYTTLLGVGRYATDFGQGTTSGDIFGDGGDGPLTISSNTTFTTITAQAWGTANSFTLSTTNVSFADGQKILIHQTRGTNAGVWETNQIASQVLGTLTLVKPLNNSYNSDGVNRAQVVVLKEYTDVTINAGVTWNVNAWNGSTGGILAFLSRGTVTVNGAISANGSNGYSVTDSTSGGAVGGGFYGGNARRGRAMAAYSGEGVSGPSVSSPYANGNGGGAGYGSANPVGGAGGGAGGGGGNGEAGTKSTTFSYGDGYNGDGGSYAGQPNLSMMVFGGGGGGGITDNTGTVGGGGSGGGIVFISGGKVLLGTNGLIVANGGGGGAGDYGPGGGGAGGSIFLRAGNAEIGIGKVTAGSGAGGPWPPDPNKKAGVGSIGRIHIETCEGYTGTASPISNDLSISCHIVEQLESAPYNNGEFRLPEDVPPSQTYKIQYGRRMVFGGAGEQSSFLRLYRQMYGSLSMDVLLSNTGVASGPLSLSLDFGGNGYDWNYNQTTTFPATLVMTGTVSALNDYLLSRTDIPWGNPVDVPVKVQIDRQADVLLTSMQLFPVGTKTRYLRLAAGQYASANLGLKIGEEADGSGPLSFTVDVGADGSVDWSYSGTPTFPAVITSPNLAAAVNAYLSSRTGEVDIPLRIVPSPFLEVKLGSFSAVPVGQVDLQVGAADISFSTANPSEGDPTDITVTVHNGGSLDSGGATVALVGTAPGWGEWYLGSGYLSGVLPGGSAQVIIPWNTLGFTGNVPVKAIVDPYNRIPESSEANNQASTTYTILTRADVLVSDFGLADLELVAGVPQTVTLSVQNAGQTAAGSAVFALYDGNPASGGVLIGEGTSALGAGGTGTIAIPWTPAGLGPHRLFAVSDRDHVVNESDEGNNQVWQDVYVGLTSPILLDSGSTGEPTFSLTTGYGFVDEGQADVIFTCGAGTDPVETSRRDPQGEVVYRFSHLLTGHTYHLDLTFYECDGAGRQESVYVDGYSLAGPVDLGDRQVHRLSLLLDPAFYIDHEIRVSIKAPGIDGSLVSEVNLHDIDYRYSDSGGALDPAYSADSGYGWLDGIASSSWGVLPYQSARVEQNDNELRYRYDNLSASHKYNLNLTFYQPNAPGRIQEVWIDGVFSGLTVDTWDFTVHRETIPIPPSAYSTDGYVIVSVKRTDASSGAMLNEISLEEETLTSASSCFVTPTPYFSQVYGTVTVNSQPAPAGTVVQALNPRGDTVGCFKVGSTGQYGFMRIYGEDTSVAPAIPGMRSNELVIFTVNSEEAVSTPLFNWQDDRISHNISLAAGAIQGQSILMRPGWNLTSFNVEPAYPLVALVLDSISGRYDRVLGETGIYDISLQPQFNTLTELHAGAGYYIHMTAATSANLLVNGLPKAANTPITLHQGWNWIGYYPNVTLPIENALQSIAGLYQLVHSLDTTYDPSQPEYSTLQELGPGKGYLIYMTQAATLIYPSGSSSQIKPSGEVETIGSEDPCSQVAMTPEFTVVYGDVTVNGVPAQPGTVIEIVTPRGDVAGCRVLTDAGILGMTHVYGAYQDTIKGFLAGEELTFRINGIPVLSNPTVYWQGDWGKHPVVIQARTFFLNLPLVTIER